MNMSMIMCKQPQPLLNIPNGGGLNLRLLCRPLPEKEKAVVVMGATGTGKSRLSIDLASRFPAEIINSDKIQVYEGLDITTNKITEEEQQQIPHHLLGIIDPNIEFTASNFCHVASMSMQSITSRGHLPIIVGGSNSYIEALVNEEIHNYDFCFLWVDVSMHVLNEFVSKRVDEMVEMGLVDEVREFFSPEGDYSRGIRKAIGVPEFDEYFKLEPFLDRETRIKLLDEVTCRIKTNTRILACRQLEKIYRLRNGKGWKLHRLDATEAFTKHGKREAAEAWEKDVATSSEMIVSRFLQNVNADVYKRAIGIRGGVAMVLADAVAAANI